MPFELQQLDNYPSLKAWYLRCQTATDVENESGQLALYEFCEGLYEADGQGQLAWLANFKSMLTKSTDPTHLFQELDRNSRLLGVDLQQLVTELVEQGMRRGQSRDICRSLSYCADLTGMVSLRFLAAWAAMNSGDLKRCIEECQHVEIPFAQIKTLMGQALLEDGQVQAAVESLVAAVTLDPRELLAWFQLAKAYCIEESFDQAWDVLVKCHGLAPQSEEVAVFMGMVAVQCPGHSDRAELAWGAISKHTILMRKNPNFLRIVVELSFRQGSEDRLLGELPAFDWFALSGNQEYLAQLPDILRILKSGNWMRASRVILENTQTDAELRA